MRAIFFGVICATFTLAPAIAGADDFAYGPNASMYISYAFDAPADRHDTAGLRYGLRMDHDWRQQQLPGWQPALLEWQFGNNGFDHVAVAGTPLVSSEMILRQEGEGGIGAFFADNLGKIVLVGGGTLLVYGLIAANSSENDRDSSDVDEPDGANDPNLDCTEQNSTDFCTQ